MPLHGATSQAKTVVLPQVAATTYTKQVFCLKLTGASKLLTISADYLQLVKTSCYKMIRACLRDRQTYGCETFVTYDNYVSRWDLSNGWSNGDDHGMFSRGESESGETAWNPRPGFYHQYFFQKMLGDRCINATAPASSGITASASTFTSGEVNVTLVNTSVNAHTVQLDFKKL